MNLKKIKKINRILKLITSGIKEQNFLGNPLIPYIFLIIPQRYQKVFSLMLLGISPHYFIYQYSSKYPKDYARNKILEDEYCRNIDSRKIICEHILKKYLSSDLTVLDFGCGPGILAREVARYSRKIIGIDVSCGVIKCAKVLNNSNNIEYYTSKNTCFPISEESIDLIYTFAVIQHLNEITYEKILREMYRVLKPGGKVICHIALNPDNEGIKTNCKNEQINLKKFIKRRLLLDVYLRSPEVVIKKIINAGFHRPSCTLVKDIVDISDDIAEQHLFVYEKPV